MRCKETLADTIQKLRDQNKELKAENERLEGLLPLGEDIGTHGFDTVKCPTFHDACHCTVDTLVEWMDSCNMLKAEIKLWKLRTDEAAEHVEKLEATLELHAGDVCSLKNEVEQLRAEINSTEAMHKIDVKFKVLEALQEYANAID